MFKIYKLNKFLSWFSTLTVLVVCGLYLFGRDSLKKVDYNLQLQGRVASAPDFALPEVILDQGIELASAVRLSAFESKPVLLHLFASWCAVCRSEQSHLNRLSEEAGERLSVVSIASYDELPRVLSVMERWPIKSRVFFDAEGSVAQRYKVAQLPAAFLIDRQGRVAQAFDRPLGPREVKGILHWLNKQAGDQALSLDGLGQTNDSEFRGAL